MFSVNLVLEFTPQEYDSLPGVLKLFVNLDLVAVVPVVLRFCVNLDLVPSRSFLCELGLKHCVCLAR